MRQFQAGLPISAPTAIIISLINQSYLPVKDLRIHCKSQTKTNIKKKLNSKIWELLNIISSLEKSDSLE